MACGTRARRSRAKAVTPRTAGKAAGKDKDVAEAIWLTLRVLVVLRRINWSDPFA